MAKASSHFAPLCSALRYTTFIILIVFLALAFFQPVETEDVWWHLKAGQYIIQNGQVPYYDFMPFGTEITLWILTQWLGSAFYYIVYLSDGLLGLQIVRMLIFLGIVGLFIQFSRKHAPPSLLVVFILLLTVVLSTRCLLRPFVFNFIFVQVFLYSLFKHNRSNNFRDLIPIPFLGLIWVNLHLGSFMYGVLLIGIFILASLKGIVETKMQGAGLEPDPGNLKSQLAALCVALALYLFTFLLTPYGIDGAMHPIKSILFEDYLHLGVIKNSIEELLPPIQILSWGYFWFYPVFFITICLITTSKKDQFLHALLFIFALFLFFYGNRANVFFVLVSGYVILENIKHRSFNQYWSALPSRVYIDTVLYVCAILMMSNTILYSLNTKYILQGKGYNTFTLRKDVFNIDPALNFMMKVGIRGPIFNEDGYGGYLLWHAYPNIRPFMDNRQINFFNYNVYRHVRGNPLANWPEVQKLYNFKTVLLDAGKPVNAKMLSYFDSRPDWKLVFAYGNSVLFVKEDAFDLPEHINRYQSDLREKDRYIENYINEIGRIKSTRRPSIKLLNHLYPRPHYYVDLIATGMTLANIGYTGAGFEMISQGMQIDKNFSPVIQKN